jgi:thiol-disulfide isomerase/thioredoxin
MHNRFFVGLVASIIMVGCSPVPSGTEPVDTAPTVSDDGVMMQDGIVLMQKDGQLSRMEKDVALADGSMVQVDGMVTLVDGTKLMLPEGMMMTMDGQLRLQESGVSSQGPTGIVPDSASSSVSAEPAKTGEASYVPYTDGVVTNGKTKVLFFHAAWCPECKEADATLKSWFPSKDFARSVYKVDYDTAKELKVKYGVTYQHTFVVVDGNGAKLSLIQGPTDEQLKALLK